MDSAQIIADTNYFNLMTEVLNHYQCLGYLLLVGAVTVLMLSLKIRYKCPLFLSSLSAIMIAIKMNVFSVFGAARYYFMAIRYVELPAYVGQ